MTLSSLRGLHDPKFAYSRYLRKSRLPSLFTVDNCPLLPAFGLPRMDRQTIELQSWLQTLDVVVARRLILRSSTRVHFNIFTPVNLQYMASLSMMHTLPVESSPFNTEEPATKSNAVLGHEC
jgi:hypothetical protein